MHLLSRLMISCTNYFLRNEIEKLQELLLSCHEWFQGTTLITNETQTDAIYQFTGIYMVGFISSLSAAIMYLLYILFSDNPPSIEHFTFLCTFGAFHWFQFSIIAYAIMFSSVPATFAI